MTSYLTLSMSDQSISHTWMTKIQETIEGGEKRSAIFTWPRVNLESKIQLVEDAERHFINANFFRNIYSLWGVPIISDKTTLTSSASSGQKIITVGETDYRHFYDGRKCIVIDPDDWESYEVIIIDTVDSSTQITADSNLSGTWPIGTRVFPLYECRIKKEQSITSRFRGINSASIVASESFESQRDFSYSLPTIDTSIYPAYNGLNLFLHRPAPPISEKYNSPYSSFGPYGFSTPFLTYGDTRTIFDRNFQLSSKKSIYDLFDFFDAQQGRLGSFYTPTWMNDITINAGFNSADSSLTTKKIYLTALEITGRHIYIEFPDKTYATREITGRPTETSITIDSAIGTTVDVGSISFVKVSFLPEVRFNMDELFFEYQGKKQTIAKTKISFKSL